MRKKIYYILINTAVGYARHYKIKGEEQTFRQLGAVVSRHRTLEAAMAARKRLGKKALFTTDIVTLHFWPTPRFYEYIGEEYVGANNFSFRPVSAL